MLKTAAVIVTLFTLFVLTGAAVVMAGPNRNSVAPLSGGEEVPPVDTNGTGVAKFKLNKAGDELHFKLNVANINDVTQAHIHCGEEGVNGPVVAFLYGGPTVTTNGTLSEGILTDAEVIDRPDSDACPGGISDFGDLLEKIQAGLAYVNVHTEENSAGEIRGQIK